MPGDAGVVDHRVVEGERGRPVLALEVVDRQVPRVVHVEVVALRPIGAPLLHESDPLVDAALHLEGVNDGVNRPDIARIALDGAAPDLFGADIVAAFLAAETQHAVDESEVGMLRVPVRPRAQHPVAQVRRVAGEEVDLVPGGQRHGVARVLRQQGVELAPAAMHVATDEAADRARWACSRCSLLAAPSSSAAAARASGHSLDNAPIQARVARAITQPGSAASAASSSSMTAGWKRSKWACARCRCATASALPLHSRP